MLHDYRRFGQNENCEDQQTSSIFSIRLTDKEAEEIHNYLDSFPSSTKREAWLAVFYHIKKISE
jgi:hypothetical protein